MTDPHRAPAPPWSDSSLDALLRSAPDPAPADFADRLLQHLGSQAQMLAAPTPAPRPATRWRRLAERAALLGAAALGMGQVLAFIFGLWTATATA